MPDAPGGLRTGSLRRRVTVAVWLLLAAMVVVLAIVTSFALSARTDGELRSRLVDRSRIATALVGQVSGSELADRLEGDGVSVVLVTADGERVSKGPLASTGTSAAPSAEPPKGPGGPAGPAAPVVREGDLYRVSTTLSDGTQLTLIASAEDARRTIAQVQIALAVGGLAVLGVAAVVLGPIVGRALRPLAGMIETARSITAGDRGRRLRPTRPDTELGRTAAAFDAMLDAVEDSERRSRAAEERLRTFLSDAAHELRTPLAGARAATEQVLRSDLPRPEREQRLVTAVRENDRAARLVDDMLTTARIDQGLELRTAPVDLTELARRVVQARTITAPDATVEVDGPPAPVRVDADRVTQILTNLVDNALRAGGPRTRVQLTVRPVVGAVELDVADDGPGIPVAESERVFDRMFRLDVARSAQDGGFGLGLTIARGLARAHGGDLVCLPALRGALFRLVLPTDPDPPATA